MVASGKVRLRRFGIGISLGCGGAWLAALFVGPGVALAIAVLAFLGSVMVADDGAGTFFPLALLAVIAIVLILMMFMATVLINS
ncbi:hypothetical protein [Erythrobacter sp. EC-HK427]|uniref:hypothetical protein n=1 Tax=Erythrobacter sp. EC-HK427 TaxID=2038396 RepID=UPI0012541575|nr:hypothetical protein [Erythrobacter sp. EC-HK427]VVS98289.1 conserved hypothetical protein [Erythrobacter sp. EC-HK427]